MADGTERSGRGRGGRVLLIVVIAAGAALGATWRYAPEKLAAPIAQAERLLALVKGEKPKSAAESNAAGGRSERNAAPQGSTPVTVAKVERRDVPLWLQGIGTAQAGESVTIRTRVDGALREVLFTEGQEVKAGDPLARIDPAPYQATLNQALAKVAQDTAQLANAERDLERVSSLAKSDYSTHQQVDAAKTLVEQWKAAGDADQAVADAARIQFDYTTIRSPIDGRVGFRQVDAGNILRAAESTAITTITSLRPATVVFTLPEEHVREVEAAKRAGPVRVSVETTDGSTHLGDGEMRLIDNAVDQTTGTIKVKAEFPNTDNALWPGQFVTARLLLRTDKRVLTIPSDATQRGVDGLHVYVVKADGTVELRSVAVDRVERDTAVVTSGLNEGETVVLSGQLKLQPGARVTVALDTAPAKTEHEGKGR